MGGAHDGADAQGQAAVKVEVPFRVGDRRLVANYSFRWCDEIVRDSGILAYDPIGRIVSPTRGVVAPGGSLLRLFGVGGWVAATHPPPPTGTSREQQRSSDAGCAGGVLRCPPQPFGGGRASALDVCACSGDCSLKSVDARGRFAHVALEAKFLELYRLRRLCAAGRVGRPLKPPGGREGVGHTHPLGATTPREGETIPLGP